MRLLRRKVDIDKFIPHVAANTITSISDNSLPESAVRSFVRNSCISFAEKSGMLKENITVDLQCGLGSYPIESLDCETVIGVEEAKLGEFFSEDCGPDWSWGDVRFTFEDDVLNVYPVPTSDVPHGLELKLIVAPSRDACKVDAQLYDKWFDAIVNGALYQIHLMPNQPWTSNSKADYRRRLFNEDVTRATIRDNMKGQRKPLHIPMNPNWFICNTAQRRW